MDDRFLSSDEKLLESGLFSDVALKCGGRTWRLHKNILCSRSVWFEKALNGHFEESKTGVVEIQNFEPEAIDWLVRYIYTGKCDIRSLKPQRKTLFITCIEVYTVGDYFNMGPLAKIALDVLNADFDARIGPMQLQHEPIDWLSELLDAISLVYEDTPVGDTTTTPIRAAFVNFVHAARFYFLQVPAFTDFLDTSPTFALDMFRAMRGAGDFVAHLPEPQCSVCRNKPTRGEKAYYTHIGPEKLRLHARCSTCASRKELPPPTEDWMGKRASGEKASGAA